jgi:hypothetical protein
MWFCRNISCGGGEVKKRRLILLIAGILVLTAGVWVQDVRLSFGGIRAVTIISESRFKPGWDDINVGYYDWAHGATRLGLVLKLAGLGILFFLFFARLYKAGRKEKVDVTRSMQLGIGSVVCFAFAAVSSPASGIVTWTMRVFATRVPDSLGGAGLEQLRSALFAEGMFAIPGALALAAGFLLLGAALVVYRRLTLGGVSLPAAAPAMFLLARRQPAFEQPGITYGKLVLAGGVFSVLASFFPLAGLVIFIWALIVRNREPRRTSQLTVVLTGVAGLLAVIFWISVLVSLGGSALGFERFTSAEQHADFGLPPVSSGFYLAAVLFFSSIFLPILCAFSLRRQPQENTEPAEDKETREEEEPGDAKTSRLYLTARVVVIASVLIAGFFGLYENSYRASLRRVSLEDERMGITAPAGDLNRLETDDGVEFLRTVLANPREFYWHRFITWFLLEKNRNPKAGDLVLETLCDSNNPIAAANAYNALQAAFDKPSSPESERVYKIISQSLPRRPECGSKLIQIMLGNGKTRCETVQWVMGKCAEAGARKFAIGEKVLGYVFPDEMLDFPRGFIIYYDCEPDPGYRKLVVEILWCQPGSFRQTRHPTHGRTLLKADGLRFPNVMNEMGEILPDYKKLSIVLRETMSKPGKVWVELHVDPFVPAHHMGYVFHACHEAGICELNVAKPEIPY